MYVKIRIEDNPSLVFSFGTSMKFHEGRGFAFVLAGLLQGGKEVEFIRGIILSAPWLLIHVFLL